MNKFISLSVLAFFATLSAREFTSEEFEFLRKSYEKKSEKSKEYVAECSTINETSSNPKSMMCRSKRLFLQETEEEILQDSGAREKFFDIINRLKIMGSDICHDKEKCIELFRNTLASSTSSNIIEKKRSNVADVTDAELRTMANIGFYGNLLKSDSFIKKEFKSK